LAPVLKSSEQAVVIDQKYFTDQFLCNFEVNLPLNDIRPDE
jgi:hypothetical protein